MMLSVLIPTLPEPDNINYLARLRAVLDPQVNTYLGQVEVKINDAPRSIPTGQKRNELIHNSDGEYFCFIDDDDLVATDYVKRILDALDQQPDVVTFNGYMTTDGVLRRPFVIRLGETYEERNGVYCRYPNHLCAFKRSVVEHVKFPNEWVMEDYAWATAIRDKGLLKTSVHIDHEMYHYDFRTKKGNQQVVSRANRSGTRNSNTRRRFLR